MDKLYPRQIQLHVCVFKLSFITRQHIHLFRYYVRLLLSTTTAELRSWDRGPVAHKASSTYYLGLCEKLLDSCLDTSYFSLTIKTVPYFLLSASFLTMSCFLLYSICSISMESLTFSQFNVSTLLPQEEQPRGTRAFTVSLIEPVHSCLQQLPITTLLTHCTLCTPWPFVRAIRTARNDHLSPSLPSSWAFAYKFHILSWK